MNEKGLQNENLTSNEKNTTGGHKITFLELFFNLAVFAILDFALFPDKFEWWFFIVGAIISIILSWIFDTEKYNKGSYIGGTAILIIFVFFFSIFINIPNWTWLIIWPIAYSILVLIISKVKALQTKCGYCKKEYAMETYETEYLGAKQISITKRGEFTDVYGKKHTNYYEVPGTKEYYMDYRRCKFCGYEDTVNYTKEYENR